MLHAQIDIDRFAGHAHTPGNRGDRDAFAVQGMHLLVARHMGGMALDACLLAALLPIPVARPFPTIHLLLRCVGTLCWFVVLGRRDSSTLERGPVPQEDAFQRLDQVLGEVEAIGNLDSIRCATARCLAIAPASIATDDLRRGMPVQPGNECLGLTVREQIDHTVPLQIHQDGAIAVTTAKGEVIDAQDPRIGMLVQ
jgi:hypothetical protein